MNTQGTSTRKGFFGPSLGKEHPRNFDTKRLFRTLQAFGKERDERSLHRVPSPGSQVRPFCLQNPKGIPIPPKNFDTKRLIRNAFWNFRTPKKRNCSKVHRNMSKIHFPEGPKIENFQDLAPGAKFSSENENFKWATHQSRVLLWVSLKINQVVLRGVPLRLISLHEKGSGEQRKWSKMAPPSAPPPEALHESKLEVWKFQARLKCVQARWSFSRFGPLF